MKRLIQVACLLMAAFSAFANKDSQTFRDGGEVSSHTFFSVRPQFLTASPMRVSLFRSDILDACCDNSGSAFQAVVFGGRSTDPRKLARYFLPPTCDDCCIIAGEFNPANPPVDGQRGIDVEARNFNIQTNLGTFRSRVCFAPRQDVVGAGFVWLQRLTTKCDGTAGLWFEVSVPIIRVRNQMHLTEDVLDNGGGTAPLIGLDNTPRVGNMTEAFKQPGWLYGRIDDCICDTKTRVGDVELKLGYNTISGECSFLSSHVGLVIPGGNRPQAHKVFEAIVGNNHHYGVFFGSTLSFDVWECNNFRFQTRWDTCNRYLFSNCQRRSMDLKGKPFSRYIETYKNIDDAAFAASATTPTELRLNSGTSGINVFTQCVRVAPRFSIDLNWALLAYQDTDCGGFIGEVGFNFWARQAEHVYLENCDLGQVAIKSIDGLGNTSYVRNIRDNIPCADIIYPQYAQVSACDLDLNSAAHPSALSETIYATIGYQWAGECPSFIAIGGSFEDDTINTALKRWNVWGKVVCSF